MYCKNCGEKVPFKKGICPVCKKDIESVDFKKSSDMHGKKNESYPESYDVFADEEYKAAPPVFRSAKYRAAQNDKALSAQLPKRYAKDENDPVNLAIDLLANRLEKNERKMRLNTTRSTLALVFSILALIAGIAAIILQIK